MIGAVAQATDLAITTAVTCPTVRIHPAVIAQAAATAGAISGGRFTLGVGSGEALNEHIFGGPWPGARVRLEMLEEAVQVIRAMFTGEVVHHRGTHYRVDHARLYTLPDEPVPIFMSAFGPAAAALAGRLADGFVSTRDDEQLIRGFREAGGQDKPMRGGLKVCWAPTKEQGITTAHRIWPTESLPGELAQVLPTSEHFQQAVSLVSRDMVGSALPCGPDPQAYIAAIRRYAAAGFDELYLQQIGPQQEEFFTFYAKQLAPLVG